MKEQSLRGETANVNGLERLLMRSRQVSARSSARNHTNVRSAILPSNLMAIVLLDKRRRVNQYVSWRYNPALLPL
jgi:hypothetical protein